MLSVTLSEIVSTQLPYPIEFEVRFVNPDRNEICLLRLELDHIDAQHAFVWRDYRGHSLAHTVLVV